MTAASMDLAVLYMFPRTASAATASPSCAACLSSTRCGARSRCRRPRSYGAARARSSHGARPRPDGSILCAISSSVWSPPCPRTWPGGRWAFARSLPNCAVWSPRTLSNAPPSRPKWNSSPSAPPMFRPRNCGCATLCRPNTALQRAQSPVVPSSPLPQVGSGATRACARPQPPQGARTPTLSCVRLPPRQPARHHLPSGYRKA